MFAASCYVKQHCSATLVSYAHHTKSGQHIYNAIASFSSLFLQVLLGLSRNDDCKL